MGRWKEGRRDGPDGWEYGNTFVNPFGGAVASFDVHGLALGRAVGVGAQRVGNLTGQLHLLFHRRVESRIEAGRRVHPTFYITKTYLKPTINLRSFFSRLLGVKSPEKSDAGVKIFCRSMGLPVSGLMAPALLFPSYVRKKKTKE